MTDPRSPQDAGTPSGGPVEVEESPGATPPDSPRPGGHLPARRTALAYAAWVDELLDRLHTLREETTDRELRRLLLDASENASRSWMSARTLAKALARVEGLVVARDAARTEP